MADYSKLPDLMEQADVCKLLHIHPNTFRARCINGKLPAVKVGRRWYVRKGELLEILGVNA
jgi:excisionase family DNA binding protein